jgi:uncharacterized membrane protein YfhO
MAKSKGKPTTPVKKPSLHTLAEWPLNASQTFLAFSILTGVLTLILFSRYFFGNHLYIFNDVGSDTITVFYPNIVQSARYFQEAGLPSWSFYIGLGNNFYPGFLLNPFYWIFLPMGPESIAHTIVWLQAAVLFGTGLIFYRFLREAEFALPACMIGGIVYTFGGYAVLGNSWYGHAYDIFGMTCAFLAFEFLLRKKHYWFFPIPFILVLGARGYFLLLFMAIYGLVRMLDYYGPSLKLILQGYKRMIILGIIALLLIMPFIGGKWHTFSNSPRVSGNVSYSERLSDQPVTGISPVKHNVTAIMRLFSNDMLGAGSDYKGWRNYLEAPCLYIGLITLLLVFQFFALADRRRKWIYGSLLFFWLLLIIFPYFRFAFYGFAGNYYKGALSLFIPFSFLFVALLGFQELLSGKRMNMWVLFASSILWLILLWYPYNTPDVSISASMQVQVSIFILVYTGLLWFFAEGMMKKLIYPALVSVVGLEAILFAWPAVNHRDSLLKTDIRDKKFHFDDSGPAVKRIKELDKDPFYRIDKVYGSIKTGYNDGMVQGFFGTKAYQSHNHKEYVEFLDKAGVIDGSKEANTRWLVGVSQANILHGLFSIKYLLSNAASQDKVDPAIYSPVDSVGSTVISRNNYYIPFGIPIESYLTTTAFESLPANQKRRSFYFAVVGDEQASWKSKLKPLPLDTISFFGTAIRDRTQLLAGKAMTMDYFSHSHIKGHIEVADPVMLFFSIPFDAGWHAKVDGKEQEIYKVNYGFTGVMLEPGKHSVELSYIPPLSRTGWIGFAIGLLGVGVLYGFRKKF